MMLSCVMNLLLKNPILSDFMKKLTNTLQMDGWSENEAEPGNYGAAWEGTLLNRISKFRMPYFLWVEDFTLPTTNNLSERGLRGIKSHMKISGQFESEAAADNHALIRTYIETCRRNNINEIDALQRLCTGNPYTVAEIFPTSPPYIFKRIYGMKRRYNTALFVMPTN